MRHPKYNNAFYEELALKLTNGLCNIGYGTRVNAKGKLVPVHRDAVCVPTGYDILGIRDKV